MVVNLHGSIKALVSLKQFHASGLSFSLSLSLSLSPLFLCCTQKERRESTGERRLLCVCAWDAFDITLLISTRLLATPQQGLEQTPVEWVRERGSEWVRVWGEEFLVARNAVTGRWNRCTPDTKFICFSSTTVQILTLQELGENMMKCWKNSVLLANWHTL